MKIFINCPFDEEYTPLLRVMLFTLIYLDQDPEMAMTDTDCAINRMAKIEDIMRKSSISIHDLSRIKSEKIDEYYRLNMSFELGLDYGIKRTINNEKKFIILENEKYSYHKGLSDYSGFDIFSHHNKPENVTKIVRDWFVNNEIVKKDVAGANKIFMDYCDCWAFIYDELIKKGYSEGETQEVPFKEFIHLIKKWKSNNHKIC